VLQSASALWVSVIKLPVALAPIIFGAITLKNADGLKERLACHEHKPINWPS
jgi:hypothetical protein